MELSRSETHGPRALDASFNSPVADTSLTSPTRAHARARCWSCKPLVSPGNRYCSWTCALPAWSTVTLIVTPVGAEPCALTDCAITSASVRTTRSDQFILRG